MKIKTMLMWIGLWGITNVMANLRDPHSPENMLLLKKIRNSLFIVKHSWPELFFYNRNGQTDLLLKSIELVTHLMQSQENSLAMILPTGNFLRCVNRFISVQGEPKTRRYLRDEIIVPLQQFINNVYGDCFVNYKKAPLEIQNPLTDADA